MSKGDQKRSQGDKKILTDRMSSYIWVKKEFGTRNKHRTGVNEIMWVTSDRIVKKTAEKLRKMR